MVVYFLLIVPLNALEVLLNSSALNILACNNNKNSSSNNNNNIYNNLFQLCRL